MRLPRKLALLLVCALLAASSLQSIPVASPLPSSIAVAQDEDREFVIVRQRNKSFDPPVVVIHEGETVIWVNETRGGWHDVQSYEGEFSSERMEWGAVFSHTFEEAGVYGYYCSPHVIDGMQGAVVVLPKGAPLPDPLPSPSVPAASALSAEQVAPGTPDTIATVARRLRGSEHPLRQAHTLRATDHRRACLAGPEPPCTNIGGGLVFGERGQSG
jgi:plastocyanin